MFFYMQDLPDDPTGQLDKVEDFVGKNLTICKWVALGVLIIEVSGSCRYILHMFVVRTVLFQWWHPWNGPQALGLFFAMTLRAISADARRPGYDSDDELAPTRQPLLNTRPNNQPAPPGAPAQNPPSRPTVRNDAWSARMREKVRYFMWSLCVK